MEYSTKDVSLFKVKISLFTKVKELTGSEVGCVVGSIVGVHVGVVLYI